MSGISESEFASFRAQSDQAFLEMQRAADQAHADFLRKYGGDQASVNHFSEPTVATSPAKRKTPVEPRSRSAPKTAASLSSAEKLYEGVTGHMGSMKKESLEDSVDDARRDLNKLSNNLREEGRAAAREAARGTSDILKGNASGLGQKAKEEAARLKEAMQQAMAEERSLKAMRGRASEEVKKARERMQQHLDEVKDDTLGDLKKMAQGNLSSLQGKAGDILDQGQDVVEREWNDFLTGQDS